MADQGSTATIRPDLFSSDLFPLVYAFNFRPSQYIHPSWVEKLGLTALWPALSNCDRLGQRLSAYILAQTGLGESAELDFAPSWRRIALIDGPTLRKSVRFMGITVYWKEISKVIDRERRSALTASIGDDAYRFALQRAKLLCPPEHIASESLSEASDCAAQLDRKGAELLALCLCDQPDGIRRRAGLEAAGRSLAFDAERREGGRVRVFETSIYEGGL